MKLRLRGNSLRLRLTRGEVASLHEQGWWQESTSLGPEGAPSLAYRIESRAEDGPTVTLVSGAEACVKVILPAGDVAAWATSNAVGLYFETSWGTKVAVEKDFRCLDEQREEDESDNFDNPNAGTSHGECGGD
jgi:hypothetical protein